MNHSAWNRSLAFTAIASWAFSITPSHALTYTVLHSFADGSVANDGSGPTQPPILASDGNFYGVTLAGGAAGKGVAYRMTPSGAITIIHHFGATAGDGHGPTGGLVQAGNGYLYGVTSEGGSQGQGTVYKMDLSGNVTVLHSQGTIANDGCWPANTAPIVATDGNVYGTFRITCGSALNTGGIVYRITTATDAYAKIYEYPANGQYSLHALVQGPDGMLYGTRVGGGGVFYRMDLSGGNFSEFLNFPYPDSGNVGKLTVGWDGNIYGVKPVGGTGSAGQVFRFNTSGAYTVIANFNDGSAIHDGNSPTSAPILLPDGTIVGTTMMGGKSGFSGTVYALYPPSLGRGILHDFSATIGDGLFPGCTLERAPNGSLYGVTGAGGAGNAGIIFKIDL